MLQPLGWKNISPKKQKVMAKEAVLPIIRGTHPLAQESEIDENLLAYWLLDTTPARLVGLAWKDDRERWAYVVLSTVALKVGNKCSVYPIGENRYRVLPCGADETPTIHRQLQAARARLKRLNEPDTKTPYETFIYEDKDGWHVSFESSDSKIIRDVGGYNSYEAANEAIPLLMKLAETSISLTGDV